MRVDALNSDNYPVRMEMTGTKQVPTSHVCSTDDSKLKQFPVDENLSQICYTNEDESKYIINDEYFTEEEESEYVTQYVNK